MKNMKNILKESLDDKKKNTPIKFNSFLEETKKSPQLIFRDIFQLFYDSVVYYAPEYFKENSEEVEKGEFQKYDLSNIFTKNVDTPFFSNDLLSGDLIDVIKGLKKGKQKTNRIFLFEGPPGSGKTVFLKNFLKKFEDFTKTEKGTIYETTWNIDVNKVNEVFKNELIEDNGNFNNLIEVQKETPENVINTKSQENFLEIPCPHHDHPILQIPKKNRRKFLDDLIEDKEIKERLFYENEYKWIFEKEPCTICISLYNALSKKMSPQEIIWDIVHARKYEFDRRLGQGISIFNSGDEIKKEPNLNEYLQKKINELLRDSISVKYVFSDFAKTNNGIYCIMDVKENNKRRLIDLHGIVSDGINKIKGLEESIDSLFFGVMNPSDKKTFIRNSSFKDRLFTIKIPYNKDYEKEILIYKDKFGEKVESYFLPGVFENFSKCIISTRLNSEPGIVESSITDIRNYSKYLDENMFLLKMELYKGNIPSWLLEEDRKNMDNNFMKEFRKSSKKEGFGGISGRESLEFFNRFLNKYQKSDKLLTMDDVKNFFEGTEYGKSKDLEKISKEFLESVTNMYEFNVLQEIKESAYYYNKEQISREIQNYLFAIHFSPGREEICRETRDQLKITKEYFEKMEKFLIKNSNESGRDEFRRRISSKHAYELSLGRNKTTETDVYNYLFSKYVQNIKRDVLTPLVKNDNFRRAINDYNIKDFNTYDKQLQKNIEKILTNLQNKFNYTEEGAKQICIYAIDNDLTSKFKE